MTNNLPSAREHFILGMSRISHFWGFPKAMGAIYGAVYLSPHPLSLDEIVAQVGVTKGAVSTNVRQLERLGLVHRHIAVGDRKDYYLAETDFWRVVRGILKEREQSEFDKALQTVGESLAITDEAKGEDPQLAAFYRTRMNAMQSFFKTLDSLVSAVIRLDGIISLSSLKNLAEKDPHKGASHD